LLVPIQQIVTFATDPFRGNPAFVIAPSGPLPAAVLHQLCRHLHEIMIAVVTPKDGGLGVSFVTPTGFHPGAGHATHAAAWVVLKTLRPGKTGAELQLDSGMQRSIRADGDLISVDWPVMPYASVDLRAPLRAALGIEPVATYESAFGAVAVFDSEETVAALAPDLGKVFDLPVDTVMATSTARTADFAIRVFAPKLGLPEDPVCGTAHRILTPYWAAQTGRHTLVSHQLSDRGGELFCELHDDVVTISGRATPFLAGSIDLPSRA
jgi:PhzF family phenazine biosynthesis protein